MGKSWHSAASCEEERLGVLDMSMPPFTGFALGIIAVKLYYPKVPGNVACAATFDFPVLYECLDIEIERLFQGDSALEEVVVAAARKLEASGVRAIVGACGFFAHFQRAVADAVNIPVFMSSLVQIPLIRTGLGSHGDIVVLSADAASVTDELLASVGAADERVFVYDVGDLSSFAPIRWNRGPLDGKALTRDLVELVTRACDEHPAACAVLLECSDLPPYASSLQRATGLPVFDFITLIRWVYAAAVQRPYYGFM